MGSSNLRLGVFATVVTVVVVNAYAPWGIPTARLVDSVAQIIIGAGALICGLVVAGQVHGTARTWRLFVVGGMVAWLIGEVFWRTNGPFVGSGVAPLPGVIAYFLPPLFVLAALLLIALSSGGLTGHPEGPLKHSVVIYALDAVIAASSFAILVVMGLPGALVGAAIPRSGDAAVALSYALVETLVVVTIVLIAMAYRSDRPYRMNYLFLASGVVVIAASDRVVAYLRSVGADSGELWGGIGFTLGPLMIGFALLKWPMRLPEGRSRATIDWFQLILPYLGFLGISVLLAVHVLTGNEVHPAVVVAMVIIILLVAARQVVAMRAARLLTARLTQAQAGLAHQVNHDPLTGLPNRLLFA